MKFFRFLILFFSILVIGCKKDETINAEPKPKEYTTSKVIVKDLLPISGGFVDEQGNLNTFSPPTFVNTNGPFDNSVPGSNFILKPELRKYNNYGQLLGSISIPGSEGIFNTCIYWNGTMNGVFQWWSAFLKMNFSKNKEGDIIYSNSNSFGISKLHNGNSENIIYIKKVICTAIDNNGTIYALTSQEYDDNLKLIESPKIFTISPNGVATEFFTFPSAYNYFATAYAGYEPGKTYPSDNPNDIFITSSGDILVAFGFLNKVFKISKNNVIEEIVTDITMPVSITQDNFGTLFVVSAPIFPSPTETLKPLEVIEIRKDKSRKVIYSDSNTSFKYASSYDNCNLNINLGLQGELFLENSLNGEIILID